MRLFYIILVFIVLLFSSHLIARADMMRPCRLRLMPHTLRPELRQYPLLAAIPDLRLADDR